MFCTPHTIKHCKKKKRCNFFVEFSSKLLSHIFNCIHLHCFRVVQEIKRYWNPPVWRIWILGPCLNEELKHRHFSCFQIAPGVNHYLMCSFLLEIKGGTVFAREFYSCFLGRKRLLRIQSRAFMIQLGWHWLLFLFPQPFQILFSGLSFLIRDLHNNNFQHVGRNSIFRPQNANLKDTSWNAR